MSNASIEKFVEELRSVVALGETDADDKLIEAAAEMLETVLRNDNDSDRPTLHYVRGLLERLAAKAMGNSTQDSDSDESQEKA